jgi:hypothetical protein
MLSIAGRFAERDRRLEEMSDGVRLVRVPDRLPAISRV